MGRVLDAFRATHAYENTIVVFSSDHGDMLGAHGGMQQKWHNAYEETTHVPFVGYGDLYEAGGAMGFAWGGWRFFRRAGGLDWVVRRVGRSLDSCKATGPEFSFEGEERRSDGTSRVAVAVSTLVRSATKEAPRISGPTSLGSSNPTRACHLRISIVFLILKAAERVYNVRLFRRDEHHSDIFP
jgi:hypothetical protein